VVSEVELSLTKPNQAASKGVTLSIQSVHFSTS